MPTNPQVTVSDNNSNWFNTPPIWYSTETGNSLTPPAYHLQPAYALPPENPSIGETHPMPSAGSNLDALLQAASQTSSAPQWRPGRSKKNDPSGLLFPISHIYGVDGHSNPGDKKDTAFGIEVENEFKVDVDFPRVTDWSMHAENSLRHNGFEYVSKPLKPDKVEKSIRRLCQRLSETDVPPTNSLRTSIHVHLDCSNLNYIEVLTFASVYWILEGFLSYFAGQHRLGNLFCLRLKDATMMAHVIKEAVKQYDCRNMAISENYYRYASVNFASLGRFCTLEFRLMRGTLDADEILMWVQALHACRTFALTIENPRKLHDFLLTGCEAKDFPRIVFGDKLFNQLNHFCKGDIATTVREGVESVQNILNSHPTFDFSKELADIEAARKKEEEELAQRRTLSQNYVSNYIVPSTVIPQDAVELGGMWHLNTDANMNLAHGVVLSQNEDL